MAEYDFSTLGSADLEELVCDLLNAEERRKKTDIVYKTYKDGKDKGIDFRYSTEVNVNAVIGQAKHYYRTGYIGMKRLLKKEELAKVKFVNPERYVFATSLDLSVANAEEILEIFYPYIKSLADVYGLKDLNRLIDQYPEILRRHYKLWFNSSNVLQKILYFQLEGRSDDFQEHELKRKMRLYVPTASFDDASKTLEENKFVIITGEPGVGKTTTAELLSYSLIKNGYEMVYIHDDIREVEKKIAPDDKKQVFYFDDFLGHNSLEMMRAKSSETAIVKILRRIQRESNKRFILTTRTFILNTAIEESERLRELNIKAKASTIKLSDYTEEIKIRLLNNHIEESSLNESLKAVLYGSDVQKFIVRHPNFSPRSVEFITLNDTVAGFVSADFKKFIEQNFNAPDKIWRHAYEQQIGEAEQMLLNTMISFGDMVHIDELQSAYNKRLDYESAQYNFRKPLNAFRQSFKKLEGGFIAQSARFPDYYELINHSLTDFLLKHLHDNPYEVVRISEAALYVRQLTTRIFVIGHQINERAKAHLTARLKKSLLQDFESFIMEKSGGIDRLMLALLLHSYIPISEGEPVVLRLLENISNWNFIEEDHDSSFFLQYLLEQMESTTLIKKVQEIGQQMLPPLLFVINDLEELGDVMKLLANKFLIDFVRLLHGNLMQSLSKNITDMLDEKIELMVQELKNYPHAQDFVSEKEEEIQEFRRLFLDFGVNSNPDFALFYQHDWDKIGMQNYVDEQMRKDN